MKDNKEVKMLLPFHQQKTSFHREIFRNVPIKLLRLFHIAPSFPKKKSVLLYGMPLAVGMIKSLEIALHIYFPFHVTGFI